MIIYKATFPNGKIYIGKTTTSLDKRISSHLSAAKTPKYLMHYALNKYKGNIIWEILVDDIHCEKELNGREIELINLYSSFGEKGYNLTVGGEGTTGLIWSDVSREKASKSRLGIKYTEETKKRMSDAKKGCTSINKGKRGAETSMWQKKHTLKTKNKMSKSAEYRCKKFKAYTRDGEFIGIFLNRVKFEKDNDLYRGAITQVTSGKSKYAKGFTFKNV